MMSKIRQIKEALKSIRVKLFITLSLVILLIILFLILVNNFIFGQFYLYTKTRGLKEVYQVINNYYNSGEQGNIGPQLEKIAIKNNFDILIKNDQNVNIYTSNKDFFSTLDQINEITNSLYTDSGQIIEEKNNYIIKQIKDNENDVTYILLTATLDNGYLLYVRLPVTLIQESVRISNNFLYLMAAFAILIAAVIVTYVSKRFTEPIMELDKIAKKMSNLDFSNKYKITNAGD